jgi:hypothetical protein
MNLTADTTNGSYGYVVAVIQLRLGVEVGCLADGEGVAAALAREDKNCVRVLFVFHVAPPVSGGLGIG